MLALVYPTREGVERLLTTNLRNRAQGLVLTHGIGARWGPYGQSRKLALLGKSSSSIRRSGPPN